MQNRNVTKLGLFVVSAFILFTLGIYSIGNQKKLFGSSFKISTFFQNVNGLQAGNNVRFAGINIGVVDDIIILNDTTLRVDMQIEKKARDFLKKDAVASIGSDGLVGNMIINISPGNGNERLVKNGDIIPSYARTETGEIIGNLGNTSETIALLAVHLLEISEKINSGNGSASLLINDQNLVRDLKLSIQNLKITTQNVKDFSNSLNSSLEEINQGQGLLGYLLKDSSFEHQINQITYSVDTIINSRTGSIMDNIEKSSRDIAASSSNLKTIIEQFNLNQGVVGVALKDSIMAKDLKQIMHNLNEGTDRFNKNMEALKHNFLFRKYFKKIEKKGKKDP